MFLYKCSLYVSGLESPCQVEGDAPALPRMGRGPMFGGKGATLPSTSKEGAEY